MSNLTYDEFIQNIIETRGQWSVPDDGYYEMHHIVPVCLGGEGDYYNKSTGKNKFKSNSHHPNCIWLTPEEHFIAHKLLAEKYPNNRDIIYGWRCLAVMKNNYESKYELTPEEYGELKRALAELGPWNKGLSGCYSDETLKKMSNGRRGKTIGHKPYGTEEQRIEAARKGGLANKGIKKSFRTEAHKKHLSEAGKKLKWYTNGVENTRTEACPDGWWPGHTTNTAGSQIGYKWYTNGIENTHSSVCPDGWWEGMTRKCGKISQPKKRKPVKCIETGEIYKSLSAASEAMGGISTSNIAAVCNGNRKRAGNKLHPNLHWEWVTNKYHS